MATTPVLSKLTFGASLAKSISRATTSTSTFPSWVSKAPTKPFKRKLFASLTESRCFSTCSQCYAKSAAQAPPNLPPPSLKERIAISVATKLPDSATESYYSYTMAEELYKECKSQGEYVEGTEFSDKAKFWYHDCGIAPSLGAWTQISALHMWTIMVRFRAMGDRERAKLWQQQFINHLFYDLEDLLMNRHKVKSGSLRTRYLKQLNEQFRGAVAAYDEGLIRGDACLAAAIWRNVFDLSNDVDFQKLAIIVSHVRRILSGLEKLDEQVLVSAAVYFGDPRDEKSVVEKISKDSKL